MEHSKRSRCYAPTLARVDLLVLELLEPACGAVDLRLLHARAVGFFQTVVGTRIPGCTRLVCVYRLISVHSPHPCGAYIFTRIPVNLLQIHASRPNLFLTIVSTVPTTIHQTDSSHCSTTYHPHLHNPSSNPDICRPGQPKIQIPQNTSKQIHTVQAHASPALATPQIPSHKKPKESHTKTSECQPIPKPSGRASEATRRGAEELKSRHARLHLSDLRGAGRLRQIR